MFFLVSKESTGGVDEEDFIRAFTDVPTVQVHCTQERTFIPFNNQAIQGQTVWDFYLSFTYLPPAPLHRVSVQIYSTRDLEDNLNKIREICSDDKHDWDQRANAVSIFTSTIIIIIFFWDCFIRLFVSVMFFNRWRRSARCWWRARRATTVSTSIYGSWMEPSNCRLKTCAHKWSERPASLWRECWC